MNQKEWLSGKMPTPPGFLEGEIAAKPSQGQQSQKKRSTNGAEDLKLRFSGAKGFVER
jgi:hypothetical protein